MAQVHLSGHGYSSNSSHGYGSNSGAVYGGHTLPPSPHLQRPEPQAHQPIGRYSPHHFYQETQNPTHLGGQMCMQPTQGGPSYSSRHQISPLPAQDPQYVQPTQGGPSYSPRHQHNPLPAQDPQYVQPTQGGSSPYSPRHQQGPLPAQDPQYVQPTQGGSSPYSPRHQQGPLPAQDPQYVENSVQSSVSGSVLSSYGSNAGRYSPSWSGISSYPDQRTRQALFASMTQHSSKSLDYHNISVDKEHPLGSGSYGAVYLAYCDQLTCAAKVLHRALSSPEDEGSEVAMQKFLDECNLLSMIRHPNIVQYLTTTFDPENTRHPILLMELCDENLTKLLERGPVPYHEQLNICFDISLALAHLHQNNLYHRDLSSNNVLLNRGQAKVTDFGMSKLAEFQPTTLCPGNPVYMSPEALKEPPNYTDRLDVFSFGVLMVQIVTRKFPDPSNRYTVEHVPPSVQFPDGEIHRLVPEAVRRGNHLKLVGAHPFREVALECLKDKETQRPSAQQLSSNLKRMKTGRSFTESLTFQKRSKTEPHGPPRESMTEIEKKYRAVEEDLRQQLRAVEMKLEQAVKQIQNLEDTRDTLALTREQLRRQNRILDEEKRKCEQKQREVEKLKQEAREQQELLAVFQKNVDTSYEEKAKLRQELKEKNMGLEEREMKISELEARIRVLERGGQQGVVEGGRGGGAEGGTRDLSMLRWEVIERAPVDLSAGSAVVIGDNLYVASDTTRTVYCYNSLHKWTTLAECRCESFSLAAVDDMLVTVGGYDGEYTNKLYNYINQGRLWNDELPAMPTARREPITLSTAQYLIVAGGFSGTRSLATIDVMTIADKKWKTCESPLPHLVSGGSMTLCDNQLYLAPRDVDSVNNQQLFLTCSLTDIFKPAKKKFLSKYSGHWQKALNLPAPLCSVVSVNGQLLAIGGKNNQNAPTYTNNSVWEFNLTTNSWKIVSHMNVGRWTAITASLPHNRLMVVGGQANWKKMNTVEIASF